MAEREQTAGHRVVSRVVSTTATEARRGQILGFAAVLAALGVTAYLGHVGAGSAAALVGGTTVLGIATVFVVGRWSRPSDPDRSP